MDNSDKTPEYEALQRRAEELRKELGMDDQPLDKLAFLRAEVKSLEISKEMHLRLLYLQEQKKLREAARRAGKPVPEPQ